MGKDDLETLIDTPAARACDLGTAGPDEGDWLDDMRTWLPQWLYEVKTYRVQRVDDRWTVPNRGKSEEQFWREIDVAIGGEPEVVEVPVAPPFRISAATLAFCLGGCILHGAPPKKA